MFFGRGKKVQYLSQIVGLKWKNTSNEHSLDESGRMLLVSDQI